MKQERKTYAVRLDKDKETRKQIAILRMGGVPLRQIAKITGRNVRTITKEVGRAEHKKLIQRFVVSVGKSKLPKKVAETVAEAVTETCQKSIRKSVS